MRVEKDFIGEIEIPENALYGIQAARAVENFPGDSKFSLQWYQAMGDVKLACYQTIEELYLQIDKNKNKLSSDIPRIEKHKLSALKKAAGEIAEGQHFQDMIIPALTGGAGTSINMNINEIISNRALQLCDLKPGDYNNIDPYNDANCYQSTNDTVPSALKLAIMKQLDLLQESINLMRQKTEHIEKKHFNHIRVGFTQLQEAVPTSIGRLFSSYNEAFSRDWWRISKAKERIKVINLGGSAAGTGLAVPRFFIMNVTPKLRALTGQPLTRSDNLADATSNLDCFVEMHSMIKTLAVNLEKMASDIRLLSSDITGSRKIFSLAARQAGSSIMPGKVNPVIAEFIISASRKVSANDQLITSLCSSGDLELNAYLPAIGEALLNSLNLLINSCNVTVNKLLSGLIIDEKASQQDLLHSPAAATALIPICGYHQAALLAVKIKETGCSIYEANELLQIVSAEILSNSMEPENLLSLGFSLQNEQLQKKGSQGSPHQTK